MKPETFLGGAAGPVLLTPDLRRGVVYRVGRELNDDEIWAVLHADLADTVAHYTRVGAWVARMQLHDLPRDASWSAIGARRRAPTPDRDATPPGSARPTSGVAKNNPSDATRAKKSATMKAVWAKKRMQGERLPAPTTTRALPPLHTKVSDAVRQARSDAKRAWWAQRKAALATSM